MVLFHVKVTPLCSDFVSPVSPLLKGLLLLDVLLQKVYSQNIHSVIVLLLDTANWSDSTCLKQFYHGGNCWVSLNIITKTTLKKDKT